MAETYPIELKADPAEGMVGWVTYEGSTGNKILHSGVRFGGTVVPASFGAVAVGLAISVAANMRQAKEIERIKKSLTTARKKAKGYGTRRVKAGKKYPRP